MRVISNKNLVEFARIHPEAETVLQAWRKTIEVSNYRHFADLKLTFNSVDKVGDYIVFNIGGNKYRVIAAIHFNRQILFIRYVFTHKEYNTWKP